MPESYRQGPQSNRPFIVTPYIPGPDGRLNAQVPSCCPFGGECEEGGCRLRVARHRRRKTGPRHPLTVLVCITHECAFTLYPPGYAPYQRQPVLNLAPDGRPIRAEGDRDRADFNGTVFEAALDAREGQPWARDSDPESDRDPPQHWWGTQGRHLGLAARLVGVSRDLSDRLRSSIAAVLSVPTLLLREGSQAVGYRRIGQAIGHVIGRIRGGVRRAMQLLRCGHLAGLWGEPLHWDARRRLLERSPFRPPGTVVAS